MILKRSLFSRLSAAHTFYLFFISGAVLSCVLAVVIVWRYNDSALSEFQKQSTEIEASASFNNLNLYISDRRSSLETLAEDRVFIGAAVGNASATEKTRDIVRSSKYFSDLRRLALISVTLETIIDHRPANAPVTPASDSVMQSLAATFTELGQTTPQIDTYEHDGTHFIVVAVPLKRQGYVEGVLYAEYQYATQDTAGDAARFVLLGSPLASSGVSDLTREPPANYLVLSQALADTSITHHYFRNIEQLQEAKFLALIKTGAALALGLGLAFATICAVGRALMLNPYKALEASRSSLSASNLALEHAARHDALTELPNRRYLDAYLETLSQAPAPADDQTFSILHIDLDRFKQINDTLGHAAGDFVLRYVGDQLRRRVRSSDFVARIGGDEFVMVITGVPDSAIVERRAADLVEAMREPLEFEGNECRFGASIGIATGVRGSSDVKKVLVNADIALYRAKEAGRNCYAFFTEADAISVRKKKSLADQIHKALENGEFFPVYQPQVNAQDMTLTGVEALARWRHPTRGVLAPNSFIQVADDLGVLQEIDAIVLQKALADRAVIAAAGFEPPRISVNVSGHRLRDPALVSQVEPLDFRPGELSFELLESTYLDQTDGVVAQNLQKLQELGIDFELDDFGTGHSSIISLVNLKPRSLKIDRQFILPAVDSETSRNLVAAMIDIGRVLDVAVVAEGVETDAHIDVLTQLGCRYFQGYAIARPLPIDALLGWMRERAALAQAS